MQQQLLDTYQIINGLLKSLHQDFGFPWLALNEKGSCTLCIADALAINLTVKTHNDDHNYLTLIAFVGDYRSTEKNYQLLEQLMQWNIEASDLAGAVIGLSKSHAQFTLKVEFNGQDLTPVDLSNLLHNFHNIGLQVRSHIVNRPESQVDESQTKTSGPLHTHTKIIRP